MSNFSMGLCGKLAVSVVWSTFTPLDSDIHWIKLSALSTIGERCINEFTCQLMASWKDC